MKSARQGVILEIISQQNIETQHQLQQALAERGIKSTQATLSRDIKDMRLIKEQGMNGTYHYAPTEHSEGDAAQRRLAVILRESVRSYESSGNLLVIKTLPGLASAAAAALDGMHLPQLVGSIAGDNTLFLAMKTAQAAAELKETLKELL